MAIAIVCIAKKTNSNDYQCTQMYTFVLLLANVFKKKKSGKKSGKHYSYYYLLPHHYKTRTSNSVKFYICRVSLSLLKDQKFLSSTVCG